jgi:hypothetical protein
VIITVIVEGAGFGVGVGDIGFGLLLELLPPHAQTVTTRPNAPIATLIARSFIPRSPFERFEQAHSEVHEYDLVKWQQRCHAMCLQFGPDSRKSDGQRPPRLTAGVNVYAARKPDTWK